MRETIFALACSALAAIAVGQDGLIHAQPQADPAVAAHFDAVLRQALGTLSRAGSYAVDVEGTWGAIGESGQGGSHYRLIWQQGHYRVEVQSKGSASPDLICVNDGKQMTTLFPARKIYSQFASDSPQATLEANKMLAMSLQGSAIDILLQQDVAQFVHTQVTGLRDLGQTRLGTTKALHFELLWSGAKVELWFAAEGDPLLLQFTRTATVPTGVDEHYAMTCTAKFNWRLGEKPAADAFVIALPEGAVRVNEIYTALAGEETGTQIGKPLPKLSLSTLEGKEVELAASPEQKATVLIFWASWCAASVEDFPAVHQFIKNYKDRGVTFYAVNAGESPGVVRRFASQHPLVSTVLVDPRATATSALRIKELPAVVLVAPDNTVRTILHGTAKELQGELASALNGLISPGSSTARRPTDPPAKKQ